MLDGVAVTVIAWLLFFGWSIVKTTFDDHQALVSANSQLALTVKNDAEPKLWISNYHYRMTDEKRRWVTVVLIHGNRDLTAKPEAPLFIRVDFDKTVTPGFTAF